MRDVWVGSIMLDKVVVNTTFTNGRLFVGFNGAHQTNNSVGGQVIWCFLNGIKSD